METQINIVEGYSWHLFVVIIQFYLQCVCSSVVITSRLFFYARTMLANILQMEFYSIVAAKMEQAARHLHAFDLWFEVSTFVSDLSFINDIFAIFICYLCWKYFISCFVSCKNPFNLDKRLVKRLIWTCNSFDEVHVYLSCLLYESTWCISECEDLFWYLTIKCLCHYNINVQRDSAIFLKRIGDVL